MKIFLHLFYISTLVFLSSCVSRGWQLSEQIQGVDNKLNVVEIKKTDSKKQKLLNRRPSSSFSKEELKKSSFKRSVVPTTFNEPGLLIK